MVEDEPSITAPLTEALEREGFDSAVARTAAEGVSLAGDLEPDLVLLDVMLPDGSGYDVCRELRRSSEVPIIMLTARGEETDRIVGLEVGADDYVREAVQCSRAGRRASVRCCGAHGSREPSGGEEPLEIGDVLLDPARHEVTQAGRPIELTRKEFEVLRLLMRNAGAVVSREQLIEERVGRELVRSHEDPRRARQRVAQEARRRSCGAALRAHRARRRLPVRCSRGRMGEPARPPAGGVRRTCWC